jgi:hypothetical protein
MIFRVNLYNLESFAAWVIVAQHPIPIEIRLSTITKFLSEHEYTLSEIRPRGPIYNGVGPHVKLVQILGKYCLAIKVEVWQSIVVEPCM